METPTDPLPRRNMRVGLMIFGILSLALGALCLLMIPTMLLGGMVHPKGQEPMPLSMLLPGALFYLLIAVIDIWLGVGSIQCKRWARSLTLLWSIFWLLSGSLGMIAFFFMSGQLDASFAQSGAKMPEGFITGFKVAMFLFMGLFYVVLPGSFTWFYSLRNTRLTCEDRHPFPAWTDRCHLSVLGLSLLSGMWAISLPFMLLYGRVFPVFGLYVQGFAAVAIILLLMGLLGWSAWGLYRLNTTAWWLSLGATVFVMLSYMVTFSNGGLMEFYRHMEMPAQTMKILEASPLLKSRWLGLSGLLFAVPYLGLMLYVRKFFTFVKSSV